MGWEFPMVSALLQSTTITIATALYLFYRTLTLTKIRHMANTIHDLERQLRAVEHDRYKLWHELQHYRSLHDKEQPFFPPTSNAFPVARTNSEGALLEPWLAQSDD